MKKATKAILFLFLILSIIGSKITTAQELSENAEIYLITCSPGTDLYSAFGHSAIWIVDKNSKIDFVYNYGVFDFNTQNFYTKFVLGQLMYKVSRSSFKHFIRTYFYEKRSVYKQKMLISSDEKQKLFNILETNYLPENRYYLYDFLYNNCSTKIIDKIEESSDNPDKFVHLYKESNISYRQNLDNYLIQSPWVDFGIDLALGLPADKLMTIREGMFLPDNIMQNINNNKVAITGPIELVYKGNDAETAFRIVTPFNVILFLSILFLNVTFVWRKRKIAHIVDGTLFGITGFFGLFLLFLWFGTDHQSMESNLNLLWAMPLNLIYFFRKNIREKIILKIYWMGYTIIMILILMSWSVFPQQFHISLFPLLILLGVRAFVFTRQ